MTFFLFSPSDPAVVIRQIGFRLTFIFSLLMQYVLFDKDLPYATLANDPGQPEEQHRSPDVQKTPINIMLEFLYFYFSSSPHEDSLDPSKLDHFPSPRVNLVLFLHPLLNL